MQIITRAKPARFAPPFGGASIIGWIWRLRRFGPIRRGFRAFKSWRRGVGVMADTRGRVTAVQSPLMPESHTAEEVVVLTANLWHDWPLRRRLPERMEAFARLIEEEGVDVVLTQEMTRTSGRWFDRWLAERLGMHYLYSPSNGHHESIGFEEGLAIFARYPIASSKVWRFTPTVSRFINRQALGAEIQTPHGNLWVFSVHLSLFQTHNEPQVDALHDWVARVAGDQSAIIGGDFNAAEHTPQIRRASQNWLDTYRLMNPVADATTHEIRSPWGGSLWRNRLDYLFLRENELNWRVVEARHTANSHSDHTPVMVRLTPEAIRLSKSAVASPR